jgi:hypothetical protein
VIFLHKEVLIICKIDKRDDPDKLIDNTLNKFEPTNGETDAAVRSRTHNAMTKRLWSTKHYMLVALVVFLMVKKSMMNHEKGKVISIQTKYIRGRRTLIYSAKVNFSSIQSVLLLK